MGKKAQVQRQMENAEGGLHTAVGEITCKINASKWKWIEHISRTEDNRMDQETNRMAAKDRKVEERTTDRVMTSPYT